MLIIYTLVNVFVTLCTSNPYYKVYLTETLEHTIIIMLYVLCAGNKTSENVSKDSVHGALVGGGLIAGVGALFHCLIIAIFILCILKKREPHKKGSSSMVMYLFISLAPRLHDRKAGKAYSLQYYMIHIK